jgi:hypothetical protein
MNFSFGSWFGLVTLQGSSLPFVKLTIPAISEERNKNRNENGW